MCVADQLRFVQGIRHPVHLPSVNSGKQEERSGESVSDSAVAQAGKCTHTTNRCPHAMYAYTGVPCAAYSNQLIIDIVFLKPALLASGLSVQPSF